MSIARKNTHRKAFIHRPVIRVLIIWGIQTIALLIMAAFLDSVTINRVGTAIAAAAVIGLLNALLWPIVSYLLVPFAVLTLGLLALFMNGVIVWLASGIVPGFDLVNYWSAFWLALGLSAINIIFSAVFTIDDEGSWYRNQVKRRMRRVKDFQETDVPGVFFLEIDGLARPILEKALDEGHMPTLKGWLAKGTHVLTDWETDTSSQTSASQAGILHGNNSNIPAFRWYDKELRQLVASSDTKMLPTLEEERSNGTGLLSNDGASRGNLFSGDAPHVMATASTMLDRTKFHTSEFNAYFADPYNFSRTLLLFGWDVLQEKWQFWQARRNNVKPILDKHHRGGTYPFIRAAMTTFMRELNVYTLLGDMFTGRPSAYATFVGYDEVAHHSGILDPGAFEALHKLDQQFARVESAIEKAPRPYHLVILSDHGQTGGATFLQRYGMTLEEFVQELMTEEFTVHSPKASSEGYGNLSLLLTDALQNESAGASRVVKRAFKKQTVDGDVVLGKADRHAAKDSSGVQSDDPVPEVIAVASGNLGIISFTQWDHRLTLEELNDSFPAVIPGLAAHEGVGFVMVRSAVHGAMAIGANGIHYLSEARIEGDDPLEVFGRNAASHLLRTDSFPNCPDILVNSFYDPEAMEGCAFEELIGFHGGMGGPQTNPFLLHPVEMPVPDEIIGAEQVYQVCKSWLDSLQNSDEASADNQASL